MKKIMQALLLALALTLTGPALAQGKVQVQ
jgi:hypothetical protein